MSFLTMQAKVARRARQPNSGWQNTNIEDYINECQQELLRMPVEWKVLEQQDTSTCVVSQSNFAVPDDFERSLGVQLEDSSSSPTAYYRLLEVPYDQARNILNEYAGTDGLPVCYAVHYGQIHFAPSPDLTYTIRHDYIQAPPTLSADAGDSVFPERILIQYALAYLEKDLGHTEKFQMEYSIYEQLVGDYKDSHARAPDKVEGWDSAFSGVAPYYSGTEQKGWSQFRG